MEGFGRLGYFLKCEVILGHRMLHCLVVAVITTGDINCVVGPFACKAP